MNKFVPGKAATEISTIGNGAVSLSKSNVIARLSPVDQQEVLALRQQLAPRNSASLSAFGAKVNAKTSSLADELLELTKTSDLAVAGDKMTTIISAVQSMNISRMNERSNVPLIGKWIDKFKNVRQNMTVKFDGVKAQIETSIAEVDKSTVAISGRVKMLEQLFQYNAEEYRQLRLHVVAAKLELEQVQNEKAGFIAALPANPEPFDLQQIKEAERYIANLGMSISNMELLEMDCIQYSDSVRTVQQTSEQLIDKFGMIKKFTFPAWKKKFALALADSDNQVGQQVASMIDDANNQMARDTATALKTSSIASAKASQRGVYDISTIEFVSAEFTSGAEEVAKIALQGDKDRQAISARLMEMKQQRQLKLS